MYSKIKHSNFAFHIECRVLAFSPNVAMFPIYIIVYTIIFLLHCSYFFLLSLGLFFAYNHRWTQAREKTVYNKMTKIRWKLIKFWWYYIKLYSQIWNYSPFKILKFCSALSAKLGVSCPHFRILFLCLRSPWASRGPWQNEQNLMILGWVLVILE